MTKKPLGVLVTGFVHVFHQLLRNGAGATGVALRHVLNSRKYALKVDAEMIVETFIFGGYQCLNNDGRNFVVFHRHSVLGKVLTNHLPIRRNNFCSQTLVGVADAMQGGRFSE